VATFGLQPDCGCCCHERTGTNSAAAYTNLLPCGVPERLGRVQRQIKRALVASNGKPLRIAQRVHKIGKRGPPIFGMFENRAAEGSNYAISSDEYDRRAVLFGSGLGLGYSLAHKYPGGFRYLRGIQTPGYEGGRSTPERPGGHKGPPPPWPSVGSPQLPSVRSPPRDGSNVFPPPPSPASHAREPSGVNSR
jgi:hypothetical protein